MIGQRKKQIVRFPPPCIKFASATFETIFTHLINALVGFYWCMKDLTKLFEKRTFRIGHFSKVGIQCRITINNRLNNLICALKKRKLCVIQLLQYYFYLYFYAKPINIFS